VGERIEALRENVACRWATRQEAALLAEHDAEMGACAETIRELTADRDRLAAELAAIRGAGGVLSREECAAVLSPLYPRSNITTSDQESRDGEACARAQQARAVARVRNALVFDGYDPDGDAFERGRESALNCILAALTSDAEPVAAAADDARVELAMCRARLRAVARALGVTLMEGQDDANVERWCLEMIAVLTATSDDLSALSAAVVKHRALHGSPRTEPQGDRGVIDAAIIALSECPATPPPLALTAEDREALGRAAWALAYPDGESWEQYNDGWSGEPDDNREEPHPVAFTRMVHAGFTLGAEAMAAAVQSVNHSRAIHEMREAGELSDDAHPPLNSIIVWSARRSLRVEAKASPAEDWASLDALLTDLGAPANHAPDEQDTFASRVQRVVDTRSVWLRESKAARDAARRDLAQCQRDLAAASTPAPADLDGYVRVYDDATDGCDEWAAVHSAGIAAVLTAFARAVETDAAVIAALGAWHARDPAEPISLMLRAALRAAVEAVLVAKVEPAKVGPEPERCGAVYHDSDGDPDGHPCVLAPGHKEGHQDEHGGVWGDVWGHASAPCPVSEEALARWRSYTHVDDMCCAIAWLVDAELARRGGR